MGFHIKYLNPNSSLNDYIQGQRYIPLLFLAVEHRSIASIKCLLELGIPLTGQLDTIGEYSGLKSFQAQSEELQRTDIMDIINNLEDTDE
ncbi:unnamed protein product, partial [Rotaria magnacalcarata]